MSGRKYAKMLTVAAYEIMQSEGSYLILHFQVGL